MEHIYYLSKDGKTNIHAVKWLPDGEVCGVVQIIHGMTEYAERYAPFAEFLASNGYIVCAEDHAGHGKSVKTMEDLGWFNDERSLDTVISDIHTLTETVKAEAAGLPYFVMGHSMGSFFCRKYISLYGGELAGAIIMGTGFKGSALMNTALAATRLNAAFKGWRNRSQFIKSLAFGSYNKKFKSENNPRSWLSVDTENTDKYGVDPLCNFSFTNNGYYILFSAIKSACSKKTIEAVPKELPVYFVAGSDDPVGDFGKGVIKTYEKFKKAGIKNVSITLYKIARHEILNDFCKDEVRKDLLEFISKNSKRV